MFILKHSFMPQQPYINERKNCEEITEIKAMIAWTSSTLLVDISTYSNHIYTELVECALVLGVKQYGYSAGHDDFPKTVFCV